MKVALTLLGTFLFAVQSQAQLVEDSVRVVPRELRPDSVQFPNAITLNSLPKSRWEQKVRPGKVEMIDGIISIRDNGREIEERILVPGVPLKKQPRFLEPVVFKDSAQARKDTKEQRAQMASWAASYYGKLLDASKRKALKKLYKAIVDSSDFTLRPQKLESEGVYRARVANFMARNYLIERSLFAGNSKAQILRYGLASENVPTQKDLVQIVEKFLELNKHVRIQEPVIKPRIPDVVRKIPNLFTAQCLDADTLVETRIRHIAPVDNYAEARIYISKHPTSMGGLGNLDSDHSTFYHSSIVAGIWYVEARRKITYTYLTEGKDCIIKYGTQVVFDSVEIKKWRIKSDSTTELWLKTDQWLMANSCSGDYDPQDGGVRDEKVLIKRKLYESSGAYAKAMRYLFSPTATDGVFRRINAASYSIGYFLTDFVCQSTANAFCARYWNLCPLLDYPVTLIYGPYGYKGVSGHSYFGKIIKGCVPGTSCFWNTPPYGGIWVLDVPFWGFEKPMTGYGYGLDVFYSYNRDEWLYSDAEYNWKRPEVEMDSELLEVRSGWSYEY